MPKIKRENKIIDKFTRKSVDSDSMNVKKAIHMYPNQSHPKRKRQEIMKKLKASLLIINRRNNWKFQSLVYAIRF